MSAIVSTLKRSVPLSQSPLHAWFPFRALTRDTRTPNDAQLSMERVMDIYEMEGIEGVVTSVGGQLPQVPSRTGPPALSVRPRIDLFGVRGTQPEHLPAHL